MYDDFCHAWGSFESPLGNRSIKECTCICFIVLFTSKAGTKRSAKMLGVRYYYMYMVDACTGVSFFWSYHHQSAF